MFNMSPSKINFKLIKHLVTIPAYVNGKGPYDFWIDTGSPRLTLLKFFADELKLKIIDTGEEAVIAGVEVPIFLTNIDTFEFANLKFKNLQAIVIDMDINEKFECKLYGCIGCDLLKDYKICIDYVNREIILTKPRKHKSILRRNN